MEETDGADRRQGGTEPPDAQDQAEGDEDAADGRGADGQREAGLRAVGRRARRGGVLSFTHGSLLLLGGYLVAVLHDDIGFAGAL
ncbi:hypothetical protein ABZ784_08705, partial [Streptomyces tendae]